MKRRMLSLFIAVVMLLLSTNIAFALTSTDLPGKDDGTNKLADTGAVTTISTVLGTVRWIGVMLAIGWLIYLGIKYVMASADEKASLKGGMIKMLIGVVILMGASVIIGWISSIV